MGTYFGARALENLQKRIAPLYQIHYENVDPEKTVENVDPEKSEENFVFEKLKILKIYDESFEKQTMPLGSSTLGELGSSEGALSTIVVACEG